MPDSIACPAAIDVDHGLVGARGRLDDRDHFPCVARSPAARFTSMMRPSKCGHICAVEAATWTRSHPAARMSTWPAWRASFGSRWRSGLQRVDLASRPVTLPRGPRSAGEPLHPRRGRQPLDQHLAAVPQVRLERADLRPHVADLRPHVRDLGVVLRDRALVLGVGPMLAWVWASLNCVSAIRTFSPESTWRISPITWLGLTDPLTLSANFSRPPCRCVARISRSRRRRSGCPPVHAARDAAEDAPAMTPPSAAATVTSATQPLWRGDGHRDIEPLGRGQLVDRRLAKQRVVLSHGPGSGEGARPPPPAAAATSTPDESRRDERHLFGRGSLRWRTSPGRRPRT